MSYDPNNPYASPTAPLTPPGPNPGALQYMEAFQYIFRNPNWVVNVLLCTLCFLIPVVGPIVALGYMFEIVESLHRNAGQSYPDFDFNRFVNYLQRGVWPFLVALIASAVIGPIILVLMIFPSMCFTLVGDSGDGAKILAVLMLVLSMIFFFLLIMAFNSALFPLQLRAGLMQDFGGAFNFAFIKDFMRRMWLDVLLQALFMAAASLVLTLVGAILFCVGMYPAMALSFLAQAHFYYQLYGIYLSRGGEPIPFKPLPPV
jgi:hypothetical protein